MVVTLGRSLTALRCRRHNVKGTFIQLFRMEIEDFLFAIHTTDGIAAQAIETAERGMFDERNT